MEGVRLYSFGSGVEDLMQKGLRLRVKSLGFKV